MTEAVELKNFFIDTVQPIRDDTESDETGYHDAVKVQMVRYSVLAPSAEEALRRYFEEEAGVESERTEPTDLIVVGIFPANAPLGF